MTPTGGGSGLVLPVGATWQSFAQDVQKMLASMNQLNTGITNLTAQMAKNVGNATQQMGQSFQKTGQNMNQFFARRAIMDFEQQFLQMARGVLGAMQNLAGAAIAWETAFTGVRKTIGDVSQQELRALETGIRSLAVTTLPMAVEEIAKVTQVAAQLGVRGTDNLLKFTDIAVRMGVATNLTAENAAIAFARISNIFDVSSKELGANAEHLGNTMVALGNTTATTESEIATMATRIAGAAATAGDSQASVLGLSAALSAMGVRAELGGTSVQRIFSEMGQAVEDNGERLRLFARAAGVSADAFAAAFRAGPSEALALLARGLKQSSADGGTLFRTMNDLGLEGVRLQSVMLRMVNGSDLLTQKILQGNLAWDENNAAIEESNRRFDTAASKLTLLRNSAHELAITVGQTLKENLTALAGPLASIISGINEMSKSPIGGFLTSFATSIVGVLAQLGLLSAGLFGLSRVLRLSGDLLLIVRSGLLGVAAPAAVVAARTAVAAGQMTVMRAAAITLGAALSGPVGIALGLVAAAGAVWTQVARNNEQAVKDLAERHGWLSERVQQAWVHFSELITLLREGELPADRFRALVDNLVKSLGISSDQAEKFANQIIDQTRAMDDASAQAFQEEEVRHAASKKRLDERKAANNEEFLALVERVRKGELLAESEIARRAELGEELGVILKQQEVEDERHASATADIHKRAAAATAQDMDALVKALGTTTQNLIEKYALIGTAQTNLRGITDDFLARMRTGYHATGAEIDGQLGLIETKLKALGVSQSRISDETGKALHDMTMAMGREFLAQAAAITRRTDISDEEKKRQLGILVDEALGYTEHREEIVNTLLAEGKDVEKALSAIEKAWTAHAKRLKDLWQDMARAFQNAAQDIRDAQARLMEALRAGTDPLRPFKQPLADLNKLFDQVVSNSGKLNSAALRELDNVRKTIRLLQGTYREEYQQLLVAQRNVALAEQQLGQARTEEQRRDAQQVLDFWRDKMGDVAADLEKGIGTTISGIIDKLQELAGYEGITVGRAGGTPGARTPAAPGGTGTGAVPAAPGAAGAPGGAAGGGASSFSMSEAMLYDSPPPGWDEVSFWQARLEGDQGWVRYWESQRRFPLGWDTRKELALRAAKARVTHDRKMLGIAKAKVAAAARKAAQAEKAPEAARTGGSTLEGDSGRRRTPETTAEMIRRLQQSAGTPVAMPAPPPIVPVIVQAGFQGRLLQALNQGLLAPGQYWELQRAWYSNRAWAESQLETIFRLAIAARGTAAAGAATGPNIPGGIGERFGGVPAGGQAIIRLRPEQFGGTIPKAYPTGGGAPAPSGGRLVGGSGATTLQNVVNIHNLLVQNQDGRVSTSRNVSNRERVVSGAHDLVNGVRPGMTSVGRR